jgi:basic membrane protein A
MKLAAVLCIAALAVAGCGSGTKSAGTAKKTVKVGLAYDIGGRGDKSFNDSAYQGLQKVKSDLRLSVKELSAQPSDTDSDRAERLRLLASAGFNPVIAVGFAYAKALKQVAPKFPKTKFAIVDGATTDVSAPNVANLVFSAEQGSFLVGAAAALKTKKKHVGFIGGCLVPLLQTFQAGYQAGVAAVDKSIKVDVKYLSTPQQGCPGFNDTAAGEESGKGMYDGGADIVYAAAGGSGSGVFKAAKAAKAMAIGVDADQYLTADPSVRDVIITSMLKRVDVAVFTFVKDTGDGTFKAGEQRFDLTKDGVGYATSGGRIDDIKAKLEDYRKQIIDGKIQVPTTPTS